LIRLWTVPIDGSAPSTIREVRRELSILEKPLRTLGAKQSIYDVEDLEDEALKLIYHPEQKSISSKGGYQFFDHVHPNCLTFSTDGRLFVGDSTGKISAWDVSMRNNKLIVENHFKIAHKELEGD
jgi:WD40 repeat protein